MARKSYKRKSKSSKVLASKSYVKGLLKKEVEVKYLNYSLSTTYDSSGAYTALTPVTQGVGSNQRIGDKIKPHKIDLDFTLSAVDTKTNRFRLLFFQWLPNNAVDLPQGSELFAITSGWETQSPLNHQYRSQYHLLKDIRLYLPTDLTNGYWRKRIILRPKRVIDYNGSSTDGRGQVFVFIITDSSAVTHPTVSFTSQFSYTDA